MSKSKYKIKSFNDIEYKQLNASPLIEIVLYEIFIAEWCRRCIKKIL